MAASTTEAEYIAMFEGGQEAKWIKTLLDSLNFSLLDQITLSVHNQSAIALSNNPMYQQRTRHIAVKYHWIRELLDAGIARTQYVSTNNQLANLCTKALGQKKHEEAINQLNITGS